MVMKPSKRWTAGSRITLPLTVFVLLASSFILHPSSSASPPRSPLYVSFIDRLPPPSDGTLAGLDEPQREAAFRAAVQAAAGTGELPPATVVNREADVPMGATRLRVYLKQWANLRRVGVTETDVLCRFYVEVVRDGRPVLRLGPYAGITNFEPTAMTAIQDRSVIFREAARRAISEMARALPR